MQKGFCLSQELYCSRDKTAERGDDRLKLDIPLARSKPRRLARPIPNNPQRASTTTRRGQGRAQIQIRARALLLQTLPAGGGRVGAGDSGVAGPAEAVVRSSLRCSAASPLVTFDGGDDGEVGGLEEEDASLAELAVRGEEEAEGAEDDQRQEVEGRVEVGEAVAGRGFEDVNAVDVEVLLAGVGDDAGEGVGEHTRQGAREEDGGEHDEGDHEGRAEEGVDVVHDLEADEAGAEKNASEEACHVIERVRVTADEGEGREEAEIDDDNEDHELDEVFAHLFEARNESLVPS